MPGRSGVRRPLDRLVQSSEFERALRARSRGNTVHFALHHVARECRAASPPLPSVAGSELSTGPLITSAQVVDDFEKASPLAPFHRLGAVVPKRYAKRSVTRSLLKRQIYGVAERHRDGLTEGVWVVRLRAPFDRGLFPSAASEALKATARSELEALFSATTAAGKKS